MRSGLSLSIISHIVVILLIIFKLPGFNNELKQESLIITDIVNISELSNIPLKQNTKIEQKNSRKQQARKSVSVKKSEEATQHDKDTASDKTAEKVPDKTTSKEIKKTENNAKKEQKKKPKKKDDDFEKSILKSIEEGNKKNNNKKIDQQFQELEKAMLADNAKEFNPNLQLSSSEIDNIKSQMKTYWSTVSFSGSPVAKNFRVTITIYLDIDGNIISSVPKGENNNSQHYRSFVESTIRAIKLASPLQNLPKEKYETWKESVFTFNPSGMIY